MQTACEPKPSATAASSTTKSEIAVIAKRWKKKRGSLIMALHDLQGRFGYVPRDAAMSLGSELNVPLARIYEVVTFYNYFRLKSPGKHVISICMGTACYLKGSPKLVDMVSEELDIKSGETTPDGNFHLEMVRCLGCYGPGTCGNNQWRSTGEGGCFRTSRSSVPPQIHHQQLITSWLDSQSKTWKP